MKKILLLVIILVMASRVWTVDVASLKQLALKQLILQKIKPQDIYQRLSQLPQDVVQGLYAEHPARQFFHDTLNRALPIPAKFGYAQQSTDGRYLVVKRSNKIEIWDLHNLQQGPLKKLHHKGVWRCELSPKGQHLISASPQEHTIKIWDFKNLKDEPVQTLKHKRVDTASVSKNENYLVSGGEDIIEIWDLKNLKQDSLQTLNHKDVHRVIVSSDESYLISGDVEGSVMIWDLKNLHQKTPLLTLSGPKPLNATLEPFFITSQGYLVFRVSSGFKIYNPAHRQARAIRILEHPGVHHGFGKEIMSSDGRYLISTSALGGTVKVWDLQTLAKDPVATLKHDGVSAVTMSLDGRSIISGSYSDGNIKIWDAHNLASDAVQILNHPLLCDLAMSHDNRYLISSSDRKGTIVIWDLHNLGTEPLQKICTAEKFASSILPLIVTPNKPYFVSADVNTNHSMLHWFLLDLFVRPSSDQALFLIALYQSLVNGQRLDLRHIPDLKSIYNNMPDDAKQMIGALVIL